MFIWIEVLQLITLNICIIIGFNLAGKVIKPLIISISEDKPFFNFFIECLVGLISIICIYSIYKSGFKTINLLAFLLLIVYSVVNRHNQVYNFREIFRGISYKPFL